MKLIHCTFLIVGLCLAWEISHQASADTLQEANMDTRRFSIYSTTRFQSWHLTSLSDNTETRLTQFSIPWLISFPVSNRTSILIWQFSAASDWRLESVNNQVQEDVPDLDLKGFGDTRIKLSHKLSSNFLIIVGLNLPTGKNELDDEEALVSQALYDEALDFRVGRLGEGWGFNLATAYARTIAGITFGTGASYYHKGRYEKGSYTCGFANPNGTLTYNPGGELNLTGGFNLGSKNLQWRSDLIYTLHTKEKFSDYDCFKQGPDLRAEGGLTYTKHRIQLGISAQRLWRSKSKRPDDVGRLELPFAELNDRRVLGLSGTYRIGQRTTIHGFVENKNLSENKDKRGGANVWAYGLSTHFRLVRGLALTLGVKIADGELTSEEIKVAGLGYYGALNTEF